jgi:hypothetical protein
MLGVFVCMGMMHFGAVASDVDALDGGETVATRHRPELEPVGARAGGFLFLPRVRVGLLRDDNIFAVQEDARRDDVTIVEPQIEIRSDWNNHALNATLGAAIGRYAKTSSEDFDDSAAEVNGRIDISRAGWLTFGVRGARLHEDRASPDDVNGLVPTEYDDSSLFVGYHQRFGRVSLRFDGRAQQLDYHDVAASTGNVNNDDRDRTENIVTARLGYEFLPEREIFVRGSANVRRYEEPVDDFGINRDSNGDELVIGAAFDFSRVMSGELFVGRLRQEYDDPSLGELDEPTGGGTITWNPTRLTTVRVASRRFVEETTLDGATAIKADRHDIALDHELLRNLILSAAVVRRDDDYRGIDRADTISETRIGAKYMANRRLYLFLEYREERRESSVNGQDYERSRYAVTLQGQL